MFYRLMMPWGSLDAISRSYCILICGCLMNGCGQASVATYPVTGQVTFPDHSPVTSGVIEFRCERNDIPGKEINARGQLGTDGRFTLGTYTLTDGAVAGKHQVVVIPPLEETDDSGNAPAPAIDPKYRAYETSGLTLIVSSNQTNHFVVIVKKKRHRSLPTPTIN